MDQIGVNIGICVGNSNGNFQLHRFTTSENIAKSFRRATFFDSHCRMSVVQTVMNTTLCRCGVSAILTPSARAVTKYFGECFLPSLSFFPFTFPFSSLPSKWPFKSSYGMWGSAVSSPQRGRTSAGHAFLVCFCLNKI